jgi:hypothetical protein
MLNATVGWGAQCESDRTNPNTTRAGYCQFSTHNLFAAHSFGQLALRSAGTVKTPFVQSIGVEQDGVTRNSMTFDALQRMAGGSVPAVSACLFQLQAGCDFAGPPNLCGVPHSFISPDDNLGQAPFAMYWNAYIIPPVTQYLTGALESVGFQLVPPVRRELCYTISVRQPPLALVAPKPSSIISLILATTSAFSKFIVSSILQLIGEVIRALLHPGQQAAVLAWFQ